MKTTALIINLCAMYLATSGAVFAESEQTSGMMMTLEDLKWKDNPRVTGFRGRPISSATARNRDHSSTGSDSPRAVSSSPTVIRMTEPIR